MIKMPIEEISYESEKSWHTAQLWHGADTAPNFRSTLCLNYTWQDTVSAVSFFCIQLYTNHRVSYGSIHFSYKDGNMEGEELHGNVMQKLTTLLLFKRINILSLHNVFLTLP